MAKMSREHARKPAGITVRSAEHTHSGRRVWGDAFGKTRSWRRAPLILPRAVAVGRTLASGHPCRVLGLSSADTGLRCPQASGLRGAKRPRHCRHSHRPRHCTTRLLLSPVPLQTPAVLADQGSAAAAQTRGLQRQSLVGSAAGILGEVCSLCLPLSLPPSLPSSLPPSLPSSLPPCPLLVSAARSGHAAADSDDAADPRANCRCCRGPGHIDGALTVASTRRISALKGGGRQAANGNKAAGGASKHGASTGHT
jgi:hypothetical protein